HRRDETHYRQGGQREEQREVAVRVARPALVLGVHTAALGIDARPLRGPRGGSGRRRPRRWRWGAGRAGRHRLAPLDLVPEQAAACVGVLVLAEQPGLVQSAELDEVSWVGHRLPSGPGTTPCPPKRRPGGAFPPGSIVVNSIRPRTAVRWRGGTRHA